MTPERMAQLIGVERMDETRNIVAGIRFQAGCKFCINLTQIQTRRMIRRWQQCFIEMTLDETLDGPDIIGA